MSRDATNDTQHAAEAPEAQATQDAQDATTQEAAPDTVQFDGDFDAGRAKTLIANLRDDLATAKEKYRTRDAEYEAIKAELNTATERYTDSQSKLEALETLREKEVVLDKAGLTRDLADVLQGDKDDWQRTIDLLSTATQKHTLKPDPAQQPATPPKPSDDDIARALFGV